MNIETSWHLASCLLLLRQAIGSQNWSQRSSSPKVKRSKHHHCFFSMNHLQFRKISRCHALELALLGLLNWTWRCEFVGSTISAFSAASNAALQRFSIAIPVVKRLMQLHLSEGVHAWRSAQQVQVVLADQTMLVIRKAKAYNIIYI